MRYITRLALVCVVPTLLAGCAGRAPTGSKEAAALSKWLGAQQLSTWKTFKHVDAEPRTPDSPDGLTLGSPNVYAAIGTASPEDLTSLDVFWADRRTVRPMAKPLTISALIGGRGVLRGSAKQPVALAEFADQTLSRVRHTSIAVSESERDEVKITIVDFAPMGQRDSFLCRWFMVEATGKRARWVDLVLKTMTQGEPVQMDAHTIKLGDRLAVLSDTDMRLRDGQVAVRIGRVDPGERASAMVLLVGARQASKLKSYIDQARAAQGRLLDVLDETKADWQAWCARSALRTGDARTDDLLDSMLCLLRSHVGTEAIHTGSLRYPHNRAWVRDSYWVQRALLELGYNDEAKLNLDFFHRAWRASGIASSYDIATLAGTALGFDEVELPHYLVLMVRDAEQMGGADARAYWEMVRGCLDAAAVPGDGLQPMNGDETWLLAAPVRELDAQLDNSWLLVASAEYGAKLAARMGDIQRAAYYHSLTAAGRAGIERFLPRDIQTWYTGGYGADGSRDLSLCPEVLARGVILGVQPASDSRITSGLIAGWSRLNYQRGIRTHARSATVTGGCPGYVLDAAAGAPGCAFTGDLAKRVLKFASATGCVWELHDIQDPAWGGEKRRLWDSAVVLMGMTHALFTSQTVDGKPRFGPPPPTNAASAGVPAPFDGERLVSKRGRALILQQSSPEHAARIARELIRQRNQRFAIARYSGQPPAAASAIIISRARPGSGWRQVADYWVRDWAGAPQLWVQNNGHVFLDTDRLANDLVSCLAPRREKPMPFPDADFDLASRFGEPPAGEAVVEAVSVFRHAEGRLNLAGGLVKVAPGSTEVVARAEVDQQQQHILKLTVSVAPHQTQAEASVTLPAGWWLVYARDMTGTWDRVRDPVGESRLPDGRIRLDYSFRPNDRPLSLTFSLARLRVSSGSP